MVQAVLDNKPYDRGTLESATPDGAIEWRMLEFGLTRDTTPNAHATA